MQTVGAETVLKSRVQRSRLELSSQLPLLSLISVTVTVKYISPLELKLFLIYIQSEIENNVPCQSVLRKVEHLSSEKSKLIIYLNANCSNSV